ncbi:MAG TPA: tripartite tricarboxylate transporter substrate binding protein [Usitatibacter sp.]|jgi:tripartite-type tricarboxylate transporter receptor subunit TctC|nr:tripartite tricarboxylate transporter substrate binding protein [Usitatibacter sp.]
MTIRFFAALAAALAAVLAPAAQADAWPARPVKMVVPFPAGGPTDVMTRVISDKLSQALGHAVVVENKPGAGGTIGADFVAKSAPDGYTLLMATGSTHSVAPYVQKVPYDPRKDFTPIVYVGYATTILLVSPALGVESVKDLIALAKREPGRLNYATSGVGSISHVTSEMFATMAGIQLTHVPYKGTEQSISDLMSGQVAMLFDNVMTAKPHMQAGRLKGLAISSRQRSPLVPQLPTVDESGVAGFDSSNWFGIFGPANTPAPIVARVNAEMNAILRDPGVRERFAQLGFDITGGTPAQFAEVVQREGERWSKVIREAHVKAQ